MDIDLLSNLMENMPDAIYFKDRSSRFLSINRALADLYGLADPALAIGKTDFDFYPEEQAKEMMADERRIVLSGELIVGKQECETMTDGSRRWFSTTKLPLRDRRGDIVGVLGISREITARKEAEDALRAAHDQLERDLGMARELQEAFLPVSYPSFPPGAGPDNSRIRFHHLYFPSAAVGGDFFAVGRASDTRAAVFICDVMGHGVRSALVTALIHALVSDRMEGMDHPGQLLESLNQQLFNTLGRASSVVFTTAFCCTLDAESGQLVYANAGHPYPIIQRNTSGGADVLGAAGSGRGAALALYDDSVYPVGRERLAAGDRILLFTDGLFEVYSEAGEAYGEGRLHETVGGLTGAPTSKLLEQILGDVRAFSHDTAFSDDVCMLCVERAD